MNYLGRQNRWRSAGTSLTLVDGPGRVRDALVRRIYWSWGISKLQEIGRAATDCNRRRRARSFGRNAPVPGRFLCQPGETGETGLRELPSALSIPVGHVRREL